MEMNNRLLYLNLPVLPPEIEKEITGIADNLPPDEPGRKWIEEFHDNKIHAVSHVYGRANSVLHEDLQKTLQNLYGEFFNEPFICVVGKLQNVNDVKFSHAPPHCDRARHIAINYLLQSGGENVKTCFYNERRTNSDLTSAENFKYNNITLDFKVCLPERVWHSYDVQHVHSVENIENTRLLFSIFLVSNPDFNTFQKKYKDLIK